MGAKSIDVYALQRGNLVKQRVVVLNDLKLKIELLVEQVEMLNDLVGTKHEARIQRQIRLLRTSLETMLAPGKPYLGMLREHILREKEAGRFQIFEQFGIHLERLIEQRSRPQTAPD